MAWLQELSTFLSAFKTNLSGVFTEYKNPKIKTSNLDKPTLFKAFRVAMMQTANTCHLNTVFES